MPTLAVQSAATPRSGAEELCKKLSSTVAGTLGKPESYVMVTFQKVDAMCYEWHHRSAAVRLFVSLTRPRSCISVPSDRSTRTRTRRRAPRSRKFSRPSSASQGRAYYIASSTPNGNGGYNGGTFQSERGRRSPNATLRLAVGLREGLALDLAVCWAPPTTADAASRSPPRLPRGAARSHLTFTSFAAGGRKRAAVRRLINGRGPP